MSSDYSDPTICEYSIKDYDYELIINNPPLIFVNFIHTSFHPISISTNFG